jgi:hypothetical protein
MTVARYCHTTGAFFAPWNGEESHMPVFILWAIPAVVLLGGGSYFLFMK